MTVMTTERPAATAGALAIRADQSMWTPEQSAVLRQSGIGESVTNAELAGFLHLCQRTGLDPFSRQIYLIGRYDRRAGREVFTPQTGIDGYRVVARRATAKTGGTYGYEDTLWCDTDGRWRDVWLSDDAPAAAKVTVVRDGQRFSAVARYSEYVQTGKEDKPIGMWRKMPASQLAKCCEALALRRAFPHDLAGVYTSEEMAQADNPAPEQGLQRQAPRAVDQWQQPAPQQQTPPETVADVPPESLTPAGRDYLHEAMAADDAATVRQIWADARAEGATPEYLAQIAEVGKGKAEAEREQPEDTPEPATLPGAPDDRKAVGLATADMLAAGAAVGVSAPEVWQAFIDRNGHGSDSATVAELREIEAVLPAGVRLRAAAERARLATVDADFQNVYGVPIGLATAQQLDAFRARIETAGGAQ